MTEKNAETPEDKIAAELAKQFELIERCLTKETEKDLPRMSYHEFVHQVRILEQWISGFPCDLLAKSMLIDKMEELWK